MKLLARFFVLVALTFAIRPRHRELDLVERLRSAGGL